MTNTYNIQQYGNKYTHWEILDLVLYLNYFSFYNPNAYPNLKHLPKH